MKFPGSITIIVGRLSISTRRNTTTSDGSSAPETSYTQRPWRKPSVTIYVEIEIPFFFALHSSLPSHMYYQIYFFRQITTFPSFITKTEFLCGYILKINPPFGYLSLFAFYQNLIITFCRPTKLALEPFWCQHS